MPACWFDVAHDTYVSPSWQWPSTECQHYLVMHTRKWRLCAHIPELLAACIAQNAMERRKNTHSKKINDADSKSSKQSLWAIEYLIFIMYNYPTATTWTSYKPTDGPAGRPSNRLAISDWLGDLHRTMPELMVWVNWQPSSPSWQSFSSDPDPDLKSQSGTVANTTCSFQWISPYFPLFIIMFLTFPQQQLTAPQTPQPGVSMSELS